MGSSAKAILFYGFPLIDLEGEPLAPEWTGEWKDVYREKTGQPSYQSSVQISFCGNEHYSLPFVHHPRKDVYWGNFLQL